MTILITGGSGFIGSALINHLMHTTKETIVNLDALTYAANQQALKHHESSSRYHFIKGDIQDKNLLRNIFTQFKPSAIMHLAAESHVDRSIESAIPFLQTNVVGTVMLLTVALNYWGKLNALEKESFRFHHVSTDEVYGTLGEEGLFSEETPYDPRSPYSASKAASDHFVNAFYHTYGLPILITNCSNNYGPNQFPEKLIPLTILKCLKNESIPVYGKGENIRDWLHVEDHVKGLTSVLKSGQVGEKYNIGGDSQRRNIDVVKLICKLMNDKCPRNAGNYEDLIQFVKDRPGHDARYAVDHQKITSELKWNPHIIFDDGISKTIDWYLENKEWLFSNSKALSDGYQVETKK
ncbi:MAG: dTDP-glucose 4,6-dehydratase [Candidatus Paracaedibacteraceae bacterium]|nr:dTDP-glucose 4,6-dehydratase [Candidatus Paracaedibacteraceae bacterium]